MCTPNVVDQPLLRQLAVHNSEHFHFGHPQGFAAIWNTGRMARNWIQVARLSSRRKEAIDNQIAFSDDCFDVLTQALKSRALELPIRHQALSIELVITSPVVDHKTAAVKLPYGIS